MEERIVDEELLIVCAGQPEAVDRVTSELELEAERRAKKTKQRHDQHEHWAELNAVLEQTILRLEARHEREQRAQWRCPGGCQAGASDCGRVRFRMDCAPRARAALEARRSAQWEQDHDFQREWHGPSGHAVRNRGKIQALWAEQEADFERRGVIKPASFIQDDEWEGELLDSFLSTWDGICLPEEHWDEPGSAMRSVEYRGVLRLEKADRFGRERADRFGRDWHPSGPQACARRGCKGCCICRGVVFPIRIGVISTMPRTRWDEHQAPFRREWWWMTANELRQHVNQLQRRAAVFGELDAMPAYLLCRQGDNGLGHGSVLCVAGGVRSLIPSWELAVWDELLQRASVLFQVLGPLTTQIVLKSQEKAEQTAHLEQHSLLQAEAAADWELILHEKLEWDGQVSTLQP